MFIVSSLGVSIETENPILYIMGAPVYDLATNKKIGTFYGTPQMDSSGYIKNCSF